MSTPTSNLTPSKTPTWRTTTIPGLYQHTPSSIYYSRVSIRGKRTFRSLRTTTWTVAQIKHTKVTGDVLKSRLSTPSTSTSGNNAPRTLGDLAKILTTRIETSARKDGTKLCRKLWLKRLVARWPGTFESALPAQVTIDFILQFRSQLSGKAYTLNGTRTVRKGYTNEVVNQTLSMLNLLLRLAKEHHLIFTNPFDEKRVESIWLTKQPKRPMLPSHFDMERIFTFIGTPKVEEGAISSRAQRLKMQAADSSEFVRFLAFTGARWHEATKARWDHVSEHTITLYGDKSPSSIRPVPIVGAMRTLLTEMRQRRAREGMPCHGPILRVKGCLDALERACAHVGVPKMTHHHLRHYFVTVCIESGVDIPTISRWLGHNDGGAQAMKTYGHLRDAHSIRMGAQVSFGTTTPQISPDAQSIRA